MFSICHNTFCQTRGGCTVNTVCMRKVKFPQVSKALHSGYSMNVKSPTNNAHKSYTGVRGEGDHMKLHHDRTIVVML